MRHRLAQSDAYVFHSMVPVYMQIAGGFDGQINQAVARDLIQHVVKKPMPVDKSD